MESLWLWIQALGGYWWALMSCAIFTILGAYVLATNKTNRWALSATFGLAFLMLLCASFLAWKDEHQNFVDLQRRLAAPELSGELIFAGSGSLGDRTIVTVAGTITNPHGPPTAIMYYSLSLRLKDGRIIKAESVPPPSPNNVHISIRSTGKSMTLPSNKFFPAGSSEVIPAGGIRDGWFWSAFTGISERDLGSATAVLTVADAFSNKTHTLEIYLANGINMPNFDWIPPENKGKVQ